MENLEMIYLYENEAIIIFDGKMMGSIKNPTKEDIAKYELKGFKIVDCRK